MSRGIGWVQRCILEAVSSSTKGLTVIELAGVVYGTDQPTAAQYEATRRAVHGLVRRELIPGARGGAVMSFEAEQVWYAALSERFGMDILDVRP